MKRKSRLVLFVTVLMLLAFVTVTVAAPAMVSAKQIFTKAGAKVVVKANVMTITKGKTVIVINTKGITKNKVAVKNVKGKYTLAKNDYLIDAKLANTLISVPAAAKPTAAKPAEAGPAATTPAATTPASAPVSSAAVGFGLTDDKAKAFDLLVNAKYSGKSTGKIIADINDIALIGKIHVTLKSVSDSNSTKCSTDGMPLGTDISNKDVPVIAFSEIATGKDADIAEFLKSAKAVSVSDNVISITSATPPASLMALMNAINQDEKWVAEDLDLTGKITVGKTSVEAIDAKMTGCSHGTKKPHPCTVTIDFEF